MGYLAIARKWRPTQFEDLVGQGHVVQTLKNAILFQRVSHAYLFSGARGIGKTSVARIFAKALRCPNAKDAVPCQTCPECLAISESRSVDVVEIDGASNNGVEAVRGIRENVAYGASTGHYKVYIIDEVHMLSLSAFNALLKTLEEPPAHVIFIFATTEVQKIPLTILSRCQRFEFRRISTQQIVDCLQNILTAEKVSLAEEGLRLIATHADGSLRDAQSLLDQVLSFYGEQRESGQTILEKEVVQALGVSDTSQVTSFLSAIVKSEIGKALQLIGEVYLAGVDPKHFAERCLEDLRLLYLIRVEKEAGQPTTSRELDISASQFENLSATAEQTSVVQLERMAQILSKTISQIAWSSLPRFVLEMAAVRMTKLGELSQIESGLKGEIPVESAAPVVTTTAPASVPTQAQAHAPAPKPAAPPPPVRAVQREEPPPPEHEYQNSTPQMSQTQQGAGSWKAFVDSVMKKRPLLGALLCHANFKLESRDNGKCVVLDFPEGSFYERQASDTKNRTEIEELLKTFFGKETTLSLSSGLAGTIKSIEATNQAEVAEIKKQALEHPTVAKMKEVLGAEVVGVNVEL